MDTELKKQFAKAFLVNGRDALAAGQAVYPSNFPLAAMAASQWPNCQEVLQFIEEFKKTEDLSCLAPSDLEIELKIWSIVETAPIFEDKLKALKLLSEIRGMIKKPETLIQNNIVNEPKIMVVKDNGTNEDWERKLLEQQRKLIDHAGATN